MKQTVFSGFQGYGFYFCLKIPSLQSNIFNLKNIFSKERGGLVVLLFTKRLGLQDENLFNTTTTKSIYIIDRIMNMYPSYNILELIKTTR